MADAAYVQDKIYYGYSQAAKRLGLQFDVYRSVTPVDPIVPVNLVANVFSSFNVSWSYMKANKYGNAVYQACVDGRVIQLYDYLVGNGQIWFIASWKTTQIILPILAINCNHTVKIERAAQDVTPDSDQYSGYNAVQPEILAAGLPCSILFSNKGTRNPEKLPTDTNLGFWTVLLPNLGGVVYKNRDIITDETNARYSVTTAELTDLGWRIAAQQQGA